MSLTQVAIMAVFITVTTATITRNDPIREHPHSVVVTEGGWAYFTCAIKLPGMIRWRIGDFENNGSVYNSVSNLAGLEGATAERFSYTIDNTKKMLHETIRVLATVELDGTPVQCMYEPDEGSTKKDSFSMFALIHVNRLSTFGSGDSY